MDFYYLGEYLIIYVFPDKIIAIKILFRAGSTFKKTT